MFLGPQPKYFSLKTFAFHIISFLHKVVLKTQSVNTSLYVFNEYNFTNVFFYIKAYAEFSNVVGNSTL